MEIHGMVANGVNVVAMEKNGAFFAMTCAWATQIDYDRLIMCIGGQSDTGKAMEAGDIIGFSALSDKQEDIGNSIGSKHSKNIDKRSLAPFEKIGQAYVVGGAVNELVDKVIDIAH